MKLLKIRGVLGLEFIEAQVVGLEHLDTGTVFFDGEEAANPEKAAELGEWLDKIALHSVQETGRIFMVTVVDSERYSLDRWALTWVWGLLRHPAPSQRTPEQDRLLRAFQAGEVKPTTPAALLKFFDRVYGVSAMTLICPLFRDLMSQDADPM